MSEETGTGASTAGGALALTPAAGILSLFRGGTGGGLPVPFEQNIYLTDAHVAGTTHVPNIRELEPALIIGERLSFQREPDNAADPLAILIKNAAGEKLGYLPRAKNEIPARLMDAGKLLYGVIEGKEFHGEWLKITMKVWLND